MRISDWSSDVCSSDLLLVEIEARTGFSFQQGGWLADVAPTNLDADLRARIAAAKAYATERRQIEAKIPQEFLRAPKGSAWPTHMPSFRSEEHTSELQSLMRISYAVFSLKKKKIHNPTAMQHRRKRTN